MLQAGAGILLLLKWKTKSTACTLHDWRLQSEKKSTVSAAACCRARPAYVPLHTTGAIPWKGGIGARGAACGRLPGISREK